MLRLRAHCFDNDRNVVHFETTLEVIINGSPEFVDIFTRAGFEDGKKDVDTNAFLCALHVCHALRLQLHACFFGKGLWGLLCC